MVAGIVPILILLLAFVAPAAAEEDINSAIARANAQIRQQIHSIRYDIEGQMRFMKGSRNRINDSLFPGKRGTADLPPEDVVIPVWRQLILDFSRNRTWSKGSGYSASTKETDDGGLRAVIVQSIGESAFDGEVHTSREPKESIDPDSLAKGTRFPIEFVEIVPQDGGASIAWDSNLFPLFLFAGALADNQTPITSGDLRPGRTGTRWKTKLVFDEDGKQIVVVIGPPNAHGTYVEARLRRDLLYRPVRWEKYDRDGLQFKLVMAYEGTGELARLASWYLHSYNSQRQLVRQDEYTVTRIEINPPLDDAMFRLTPTDGMVFERIGPTGVEFGVAGDESLTRRTHYDVQDAIEGRRWRWLKYLAGPVVALTAVLIFLFVRRLKKAA